MASLETCRIMGAQLVGPDSPTYKRELLYASITPGTPVKEQSAQFQK